MAIDSLQHTQPATQHTLLIAGADHGQRTFLAGQLDGDGHTVYDADHQAAVIANPSSHAIDVVLGALEKPSEATALVRSIRAGRHPRVHPGLAVIHARRRRRTHDAARLRERQRPPPPHRHGLRPAAP